MFKVINELGCCTQCDQSLQSKHRNEILCPANIYLFKVNYRNTKKRCEICLQLAIKTPERHGHRYAIYVVNFEHISHHFLVFL